jgi:hypothetical protein
MRKNRRASNITIAAISTTVISPIPTAEDNEKYRHLKGGEPSSVRTEMDELPLKLPEQCIETASVKSGCFHPKPACTVA